MASIWIFAFLSVFYTTYAAPFLQRVPGQTYAYVAPQQFRSKVDEIAKAYAEGYKAALQAVQARSFIPQAPMQQYTPRSYIPRAPQIQPNIQRTNNAFNFPPARQITVNGIEKSGIPHPNLLSRNNQALMRRNSIAGHNMVERSAPQMPALLGQFLQQQQQQQPQVLQQRSQISKPEEPTKAVRKKMDDIAKLNHAARHRNVYLDSMGGDPYGGSSVVLTRQHFWLNKKHKRSAEEEDQFKRFKRSHAPYLGQDLDKFGIVRVQPNFNSKVVTKQSLMQSFAPVPEPKAATAVYQQPSNQFYGYQAQYPNNNNLFARGGIQQAYYMMPQNTYQYPQQRMFKRQAKADDVAKMNYAARHRNVYLDTMGGDPYGGSSGVLSRQNVVLHQHKKRQA